MRDGDGGREETVDGICSKARLLVQEVEVGGGDQLLMLGLANLPIKSARSDFGNRGYTTNCIDKP